jgi:hypothetical protein
MDDVAPMAGVLDASDKHFWTAKNHESGIGECNFDNGDKYIGQYSGNAMHGKGSDWHLISVMFLELVFDLVLVVFGFDSRWFDLDLDLFFSFRLGFRFVSF